MRRAALFVIIWLSFIEQVWACTCTANPNDFYQMADTVLVVKLEKVWVETAQIQKVTPLTISAPSPVEITYAEVTVEAVWKQKKHESKYEQLKLQVIEDSSDCPEAWAYSSIGTEFLVYASYEKPKSSKEEILVTSLCDGTKKLKDAEADMENLHSLHQQIE